MHSADTIWFRDTRVEFKRFVEAIDGFLGGP
jgi:hypothetical protein